MSKTLRVLMVEDSLDDAELILRELKKREYDTDYERVETGEMMLAALESREWDIVISDYVLPQFSGLEALNLLQRRNSDVPCIITSGRIDDETAVAAMKAGAKDYIMKDNLKRLGQAIERELSEAQVRRERRKAEETLKQLNRAREVLIKINETLIRSANENELLQMVCRILIETGSYRMSWVGYIDESEEKRITPVAFAGYVQGYLDNIQVTWSDTDNGHGPSGFAIRTCRPYVVRDIQTDPTFFPWREAAIIRSYASSVSLPLSQNDHAFGVLNIYSDEKDHFNKDELELLSTLTSDLSFGILALRIRVERDGMVKELRSLSRKLVEVQETERRNIARELHDEIGQSLTALRMLFAQIIRSPGKYNLDTITEANQVLTELMKQVREMSLNLRPSMLDDLGLLPTLLWHFERFTAQTGIEIKFDHTGLQQTLPTEVNTTTYRIVQEGLTNIARYADVKEANISIRIIDDTLFISIRDSGRGFSPLKQNVNTAGLSGMRERVLLLNGKFSLNTAPGEGTHILVELPVQNRK